MSVHHVQGIQPVSSSLKSEFENQATRVSHDYNIDWPLGGRFLRRLIAALNLERQLCINRIKS